jgi:hypothetical protein
VSSLLGSALVARRSQLTREAFGACAEELFDEDYQIEVFMEYIIVPLGV